MFTNTFKSNEIIMLVWIFVENNVNGCSTAMKNRELKRQQSNRLSSEFKC